MKEESEEALARELPFMRRRMPAQGQRAEFVCGRSFYNAAGLEIYDGEGLDMGNGWYPLIHDMCAEITAVYAVEGRPVDIVVEQAKEKGGTLRFYYRHEGQKPFIQAIDFLPGGVSLRKHPGDSELQEKAAAIVNKYEDLSAHVCEICGKPGELRTDRFWHCTMCPEHYQKDPGHRKEADRQREEKKGGPT